MKKLLIILLLFYFHLSFLITQNSPKLPDEPILKDDKITNKKDNEKTDKEKINNIQYQNKKGEIIQGVIDDLKGNYINLSWAGNETGAQKILFDFIKSIKIKEYTMVKKTKENLSVIFYFPNVYDLELKDGRIIKDAKGRINEIESFLVYNSIGKQKCYTYFIRYWLEDKQIFNDNKSSDYNEFPNIPESVITYIEFKK